MKIKITNLATQDITSIKDYISRDNPNAAMDIIQRIIKSIDNIELFPDIGRPGRVPQTKELVISGTPLIIIYKLLNNSLYIIRIIHSSRKWP